MKKYVIKIFLALLVICLLSSFSSEHDGGDIIQVPQMKQEPSHASHLTDYGYFDGLLYYKITSNSTNEVAVVKAESSAIDVTIPSQVIIDGKTYTCTRIEDKVFKDLKRMTSVTIPNSITTIGVSVFYGCSGLTSIFIPNSVTSIGNGAFAYCSGLTSVTISNSVTYIGSSAFYECSSLTSLTIPNSVIFIGNHAFEGCNSLSSVTIPNSVSFIGDYAFNGCSRLTSVSIPNSVTSIGSWTFWGCVSLTSVSIPNSVTSIGDYAFCWCRGLTSVTIPNGVISIGTEAFSGCSGLTSITIPNSVTTIGEAAFYGCSALTSVTIPNSVTTIGEAAFYECSNITEVVSWIENPFEIAGKVSGYYDESDYGTFDLVVFDNSTLYVPVGTLNKYMSTKGWKDFAHITENIIQGKVSEGVTYIYDKITHTLTISGQGPMEIGDFDAGESAPWLLYANDIQHVIIESGVTSIGSDAFHWCNSLTSVTIPRSVTSIGSGAFEECNALTSITIPNSVTSIGSGAFYNCSSITSITIPNSVTSIGRNPFSGCYGLNSILVESGNQKYDSRKNSNAIIETSSNSLIVGCKNTIIPNSVISIGEGAFSGCSGLTSVTIPNNVTSIGNSAFAWCSGLTSIVIPNNVTSIGSDAFSNCSSLTSINIPSSVTSIGGGAFSGTKWYDNQPNGIVYAGRFVYNYKGDMPANSQIIIEDGTVGIVGMAFYNCSNLSSVTIPSSVTTIGGVAFLGCSALTSITIPSSVTSIGNSAFYGCTSLKDYYVWAEIMPSTNDHSFSSAGIENATLHVPSTSVEIYRQTDPWSGFGKIVPLTDEDLTNMKGIMQSDNLNGEYYDLSGRKVNNPKKGLYIKNGKKVVLK